MKGQEVKLVKVPTTTTLSSHDTDGWEISVVIPSAENDRPKATVEDRLDFVDVLFFPVSHLPPHLLCEKGDTAVFVFLDDMRHEAIEGTTDASAMERLKALLRESAQDYTKAYYDTILQGRGSPPMRVLPQVVFRQITGEEGSDTKYPNLFEGVVEGAVAAGLVVESTYREEPPAERRIQASGPSITAIIQWDGWPFVLFFLAPAYTNVIYPWLKEAARKLWGTFIRPDKDAFRRIMMNAHGVIPVEYSLTFCMEAALKDGRKARLLFKENSSGEDCEKAVLAFWAFLHDGGDPKDFGEIDIPSYYEPYYKRLLPLTYDSEKDCLVVVALKRLKGDPKLRVEPTV